MQNNSERQNVLLYHLWNTNGAWEIPAMATTVYITNKAKGRNIREENALEKQLRGKKTK